MTNHERFKWLKQDEHYFEDRGDIMSGFHWYAFREETEEGIRGYKIIIPKNAKKKINWTPLNMEFEELPIWFKNLYIKAEELIRQRDLLRKEVSQEKQWPI